MWAVYSHQYILIILHTLDSADEIAIHFICRQDKEQQRQQEYDKQQQREKRRKEKELKKIRDAEEQQLNSKIKSEEKKLLIAQRKLESIRLLESLFERVKVSPNKNISKLRFIKAN